MTDEAHTPAPWDWQDGVLIGNLDGEGEDVSFAAIGNTRLIAAAPDLLAASEAFMSELDSGDNFMAWEKAKAELRAAIAKAKGLTA